MNPSVWLPLVSLTAHHRLQILAMVGSACLQLLHFYAQFLSTSCSLRLLLPFIFLFFKFPSVDLISAMSHSPKPPSLAPSRRSIFREEFSSQHTLPHLNLGLPAAEDHHGNSANTTNMAAFPTPREVRRLASDHNFVLGATDPAPRRLGILSFIGKQLSLVVALIAGIISVAVAIAYTVAASKQLLQCPAWANDCRSLDLWTAENLGAIQGIITAVYLIGLSAFAYVCQALCEAALWPLLHTQTLTISALGGFLALNHGNIMSLPQAATGIRSLSAAVVFVVSLLAILLPLAAPPLVGYACTPILEAVTISSNISSSASSVLDRPFTQTNPPSPAFIPALSAYNTYANNPASEPLPSFRNWLFDRSILATRGSFTAKAVHLDTNITCHGQQLQQLHRNNAPINAFKTTTNLSSSRHKPSGEVWFTPQPHLTVFLDDVNFHSTNIINTTIILAAINGTISGGQTTNLTLGNIKSVSAISCSVLLSVNDDVLTIGPAPPNPTRPVLSSLSDLNLTSTLLWLTASPLLVTQAILSNSTLTRLDSNKWTIPGLESFLHFSIAAMATSLFSSSPSQTPTHQQKLVSAIETKKLSTERAFLLLVPPLLYTFFIIFMALWDVVMHKKYQIPVMRGMSVSEVTKSSQTAWMREQAGADGAKSHLPSQLGGLSVRFGVVGGGEVGFGPARGAVSGFVMGKDKGKGRDGSRVHVGGRVHPGHSSVSWVEEEDRGGRDKGRGYRAEGGEWPRNSDL
ncbi:uncharacterized protein PODANS_5_3580 [Podospora anserina S mat+]|uniref:Podospora anserina S mat+ genomic DNA chromosome 5, supercontig 4 n=1 Tax=Podospora anserina (strain S / ATCC MYA-4624 / DSM 980 / FGSC 10383) TaxID=515849 RepID=B2ALG7_PODAN|nr:uncharacterized protein PODANS_5_3580 [Podospora anserina S mat+]CAP64805.1 unnamed protein product [Podospora anserina S mat+]CDP29315.1 Putative protein of unknown function [Podospora anserina S mat+]